VGACHGRVSNVVPHAASIVVGGSFVNTGGVTSAVTVKLALHVVIVGAQLLV
jgi:hypothetical protein